METTKEASAMSDPVMKALFVTLGLVLLYQLGTLLPHAAEKPLLRCLIHAVMGLCTLLLGNTVGGLFGLGLGLNALTIPVSAGLGIPGVAVLWVLRYML